MPAFDPNPGDVVKVFDQSYRFLPLPGLPHLPYAAEGGRGRVYRVRGEDGSDCALKLFLPGFRNSSLVESTARLTAMAGIDGLSVASRRVVTDERTWRRADDLKYAVIMPWIDGETWYDILLNGKTGRPAIPSFLGIPLAKRFVYVMAGLEARGWAHCDVSPGNVSVDLRGSTPGVQLLDLEDMYLPGAPPPTGDYIGSPGYQHRAKTSVWGPHGDRFATAIMTTEMLILPDATLSAQATELGFFGGHALKGDVTRRFDEARASLDKRVPAFTPLLERAWRSRSLDDCPSIVELYTALQNTHVEEAGAISPGTSTTAGLFTFVPISLDDSLPARGMTSASISSINGNGGGTTLYAPPTPPPDRRFFAPVGSVPTPRRISARSTPATVTGGASIVSSRRKALIAVVLIAVAVTVITVIANLS